MDLPGAARLLAFDLPGRSRRPLAPRSPLGVPSRLRPGHAARDSSAGVSGALRRASGVTHGDSQPPIASTLPPGLPPIAAMSRYAIETNAITKRYSGSVLAVDGVSVRVERGEIYGFLGLNGAGKSTMIRMLLGMIAPTSGEALLFGSRVHPGATDLWRRVGYLVETATAYPELTVHENLEASLRLHALRDLRAIDAMIGLLSLGEYAGRAAGTLSLGNLQRVALARALLHRPELLVLDEPANSLDPAGVVEIRELLRRLAQSEGVTVFMSSHVLAEVERLATRIGILHRGRLVEELRSEELERRRARHLEVGARDLDAAARILAAAGYAPTRVHSGTGDGPPVLELREPGALDAPDEVAGLLASAGLPPLRLAIVQEDLEEHFLRVTSAAEGSSQ
jgi:ABC-2 type transport system ATP-binding protein